jgi:uncharacterized protein Yka (UPF0111/DUF47 family)
LLRGEVIKVGVFSFFKSKPDKFLYELEQQAKITERGVGYLLEYVKSPSAEAAAKVKEAEEDADEERRILIDELNRTFITPIDREDIFALSRTIDDVLDYAYTTVDEMQILGVKPNQYIERMVSLLYDSARELRLAIERMKKHPSVASEHAMRAKAMENRIERVYREAISELFSGPEDLHHVVEMLKYREVYRHLSNAADRGDEAANVIADVVVKTT